MDRKIMDQMLDKVTGGVKETTKKEQFMRMECPYCHDIFQADVMKDTVECPTCKRKIEIKG